MSKCVSPPSVRSCRRGEGDRLSVCQHASIGRMFASCSGEEGIQQRKGKRKSIYCYTLPNKRRRRWQLLNIIGHFFLAGRKKEKKYFYFRAPICRHLFVLQWVFQREGKVGRTVSQMQLPLRARSKWGKSAIVTRLVKSGEKEEKKRGRNGAGGGHQLMHPKAKHAAIDRLFIVHSSKNKNKIFQVRKKAYGPALADWLN